MSDQNNQNRNLILNKQTSMKGFLLLTTHNPLKCKHCNTYQQQLVVYQYQELPCPQLMSTEQSCQTRHYSVSTRQENAHLCHKQASCSENNNLYT